MSKHSRMRQEGWHEPRHLTTRVIPPCLSLPRDLMTRCLLTLFWGGGANTQAKTTFLRGVERLT